MKTWYIPVWSGDIRIERKSDQESTLTVIRGTPEEMAVLRAAWPELTKKRGFTWTPWTQDSPPELRVTNLEVTLQAPVEKVGRLLAKKFKTGNEVVHAYKFTDGHITVEQDTLIEQCLVKIPTDVEAAATTKLPKRGCPSCVELPHELRPRAVLMEFLDPEQRLDFARKQMFECVGNQTGTRYAVLSRHSAAAANYSRALVDIDKNQAVCASDWTLPVEEEMLGLKLLVEFFEGRIEPWAR